jgi:MFS family permease
VLGSVGCAFAGAPWHFVLARFIQGMGGAMMTPVGRLVLVRTVEKRSRRASSSTPWRW